MPRERRIDPAGFVIEKVDTLRERLTGRKHDKEEVMWLNHFDLLPGDDTVTVTHASTSSGIGGGLTAAVIHSTTTGDVDASGGNKVVHMAVEVPPGYLVTGVRLGYELTSSATNITQIRLSQVQDPPKTADVCSTTAPTTATSVPCSWTAPRPRSIRATAPCCSASVCSSRTRATRSRSGAWACTSPAGRRPGSVPWLTRAPGGADRSRPAERLGGRHDAHRPASPAVP